MENSLTATVNPFDVSAELGFVGKDPLSGVLNKNTISGTALNTARDTNPVSTGSELLSRSSVRSPRDSDARFNISLSDNQSLGALAVASRSQDNLLGIKADAAPLVGNLTETTTVAIAATSTGSQTPAKAPAPNTVTNGDFLISGTNATATVGDGVDELTTWAFDFTQDPNLAAFLNAESLSSATLTLELTSTTTGNNDTPGIDGLRYIIFPDIANLPLGQASTITINLLNTYSSEEVLAALKNGELGKIPMYYADDAIVSSARVELTADITTPSDWYSQNLENSRLSNLTRLFMADGFLNREEMIALLNETESENTITRSELKDLRKIINYVPMPEEVNVLAGKVVNGDPANSRSGIGNLRAGSGASQMEALIRKWFLGKDYPTATKADDRYVEAQGDLFQSDGGSNPIAYTDVDQGQVGNCYFMAALATTAQRAPKVIQTMFIPNNDNTFTVRFFKNGKADYITVDRWLPVDANDGFFYANNSSRKYYDDPTNELWVALAEKAYAQLNESGWIGQNNKNSYEGITGGQSYNAIRHITGSGAGKDRIWRISPSSINRIIKTFDRGQLVTLSTRPRRVASKFVKNHAYAMIGYDTATRHFQLYNPWKDDGPILDGADDGIIWATRNQINKNFEKWHASDNISVWLDDLKLGQQSKLSLQKQDNLSSGLNSKTLSSSTFQRHDQQFGREIEARLRTSLLETTTITASDTAQGSRTPLKAVVPNTVTNGDFLISSTNPIATTVGDSLDERTTWTFDLTQNLNLVSLLDANSLSSATLTLELLPGTTQLNDTPGIEGLQYITFPGIATLPVGQASTITINLLDTYSFEQILGIIRSSGGKIPMYYADDAIVSFAKIELTTESPFKRLRADTTGVYGQYGVLPAVNNVPETFARASGSREKRHQFLFFPKARSLNGEKPDAYYFNPFTKERDHIQSVARISGQSNENLLAFTRSARDTDDAALYVALFNGIQSNGDAWKFASRTSDTASSYFYYRFPGSNHAGGMQALGAMVFVASDSDNKDRRDAYIQVLNLSDLPGSAPYINQLVINPEKLELEKAELFASESSKRVGSRAAAVAAVRLDDGRYLLFVRQGGKKNSTGWFFISKSSDIKTTEWSFLDFWQKSDLPKGTQWEDWETINFIPEVETGDIYMIGMGTKRNKSFLYHLTETRKPNSNNPDLNFEYINGRGLKTPPKGLLGVNTRYGAGIHITPNRNIVSYVTDAIPKPLQVNEFRYEND